MRIKTVPPQVIPILGALLIGLGLFGLWPQKNETTKTASAPLAQLKPLSSGLTVSGKKIIEGDPITLERFDLIATNRTGTGLVTLENGEVFRILPSTELILDRAGGQIQIVVKGGKIVPEQVATTGQSSLLIANSKRTQLALEMKKTSDQTAKGRKKAKPLPLATEPISGSPQGLASTYIQQTLEQHQNIFFKCYSQLLQRTPAVQGHATLEIQIENTGHIRRTNVQSSNLVDQDFQTCLKKAAQRIEFKNFAGDSIQVVFPIRFE